MTLKIPVIRTREDYYRALFGSPKEDAEDDTTVLDNLKAEAEKREKELEGKFHIQELPDRYVLHNLEYHDGIYTVGWSKKFLEDGAQHIQEDWMRLTQDTEWQKQNDIWQVPSAPLYHATIAALYNNQDHPIAEQQELVQAMREIFQKDFAAYCMMTSTRTRYAGKKKGLLKRQQPDTMTHDWNTPHARTVQGKFVGPDGYINASCGFDTTLEAILESKDLTLIEEAYEWIGQQGKKPYLWRVNNQPDEDTERAVVFGLLGSDNWFYIGADIYYYWPVRGVVTQRKKFLHEK
jgi:hypothetical protein